MKIRHIVLAGALSIATIAAIGCTDFERTAFQSLSGSKAVLDTAQQDYEPAPVGTGKLPHNACVYALINDGKAAQTAAVDQLQVYDVALKAGQSTAAAETTITAELATIAVDVGKVKALYSNPSCT